MSKDNKEVLTFEEKLGKMEEIVRLLQNPGTSLQNAIDAFEEGMALATEVDKELSKIERRIEIVTSAPGESDNSIMTEPYKAD
ncbi:MAG: exodeoxyribonuclease VII small subunit [Sphaerochaetaceae bacterium]|nr:exodeoxyribonuclease VII small subunit [Sphaerochaetaceae bacterium]